MGGSATDQNQIIQSELDTASSVKSKWKIDDFAKFLTFIRDNQQLFASEKAKRRSQTFQKAARYMGLPFTNTKLRKKFNCWLKKYHTLQSLIKEVGNNITRNAERERKMRELKCAEEMEASSRSQPFEYDCPSKEQENILIKNGVFIFADYREF